MNSLFKLMKKFKRRRRTPSRTKKTRSNWKKKRKRWQYLRYLKEASTSPRLLMRRLPSMRKMSLRTNWLNK